MRNTLTTTCCLFAISMLAACSGDHELGSDVEHSHASDHSEADHSHGEDTHGHDDAPETEALYGDNAALSEDAAETDKPATKDSEAGEADTEEHTHGDSHEPHSHN